MEVALQLPALLETAETWQQYPRVDNSRLRTLWLRLLQLESELVTWLERFNSLNGDIEASALYTTDLRSDLPQTVYRTRRLPAVTTPAVQFHSYPSALYNAFSWMCLLLLRQTLWELSRRLATENPTRDFAVDAEASADFLCASLPFLIGTAGSLVNIALSIRAPLYFASRWFRVRNNAVKLEWCRETEQGWREQLKFLQWDTLLIQNFLALSSEQNEPNRLQ